MSLRFSTGFVNALASGVGYYDLLSGGKVEVYTGTQPTTADTAPSGTLLFTATAASAAHTAEVKARSTITIVTGHATNKITALTFGGVDLIAGQTVAASATTTTLAANLAAAINASYTSPDYFAVASSSDVAIYAPKGSGSSLNGLAIALTAEGTTIQWAVSGGATQTATGSAVSNGTVGAGTTGFTAGAAAVAGVTFTYPVTAGALTKASSPAWTAAAVATGTAGWFRFKGGNWRTNDADGDTTDTTTYLVRMDGSIGTSGTDMTVASTSVTSGATQTINTFTLTVPTA